MRTDGNSFSVSTRVQPHNRNENDLWRHTITLLQFWQNDDEDRYLSMCERISHIGLIFGYKNEDGKPDKFAYRFIVTPDILERLNARETYEANILYQIYNDCIREPYFTKIVDKIDKIKLVIECHDLSE